MKKPVCAIALIVSLTMMPIVFSNTAVAQEQVILPAAITFATSTGYWEDSNDPSAAAAPPSIGKPARRHGYYKLFAVRQADRTSKVYLQQIVVADDGLQVLSTSELRELSDLKPYVTDIRPENPDGFIKEPGLFATVILRTDPDGDTQRWRVAIDDLGEITVEKPSD